MIDYSIISECYIDTNLIETIVPSINACNHQKGCGTVTMIMQKKFQDKFAVGIVDKDKKELKYANEFDEIINLVDLQLFRHKNYSIHHYLIFIKPAIEVWILNASKEAGISMIEYGLSDDLFILTKRTKKITSKNDNDFKKLFKELKGNNLKNINILSAWLKYLHEKTYNTNLYDLINITNQCLK